MIRKIFFLLPLLTLLTAGLLLACGTAALQDTPAPLPAQELAGVPQTEPTFTPAPAATPEPAPDAQTVAPIAPPEPSPTNLPAPVETPATTELAPTPTSSPTPTPTATPVPTFTPVPALQVVLASAPTATPAPPAIQVATPTPTATVQPSATPTLLPTQCVQGVDTPSGEVCFQTHPTPTLQYPKLGYNFNKAVVEAEETVADAKAAGLDPSTVDVGNQFVYVRFESENHREFARDWLEKKGLQVTGFADLPAHELYKGPIGIIMFGHNSILMVIPTTWLGELSELDGVIGVFYGR